MPPAVALESPPHPLERIRVALFGAGLVGQAAHAPTLWDDRARFDFVAVADPSSSVCDAIATRYGVPNACATLEDALALDLDAVVIAVPDPVHRDAVLTALGAEPDAAESRAFEAYLSSLVHDVSLAHHLLRSVGMAAPLPIADASYFDGGRGVSLAWTLPGDGRAHLEHLNLPGVADYRERITAYCRDRILALTFPSPYLRHHPTRLGDRHSDGTVAGLETIGHRVSYEEAFRNELRAFHAAITTGVPVRASVEAARDDLAALLDGFRLAVSRHRRVA